jgi:cytidyltransferase-like protein
MVTEGIRTNIPFVYDLRILPKGEVFQFKVPAQIATEDLPYGFWIDVYGMQEYDGVRSSVVTYESAYRSKLYYQKNLKQIKFEGFDFYVSKYVEKYLDYIYRGAGGKTWRTPVARSVADNWEDAMPSYNEEDKITGCAEGVFDMYHKGHVRLFQKMKDIFDKVVAVVTPDEVVANYKSTPLVFCYEERVEILRSCKYIDEVIPATEERPTSYTTIKWMEENDIDYMVHGKTDEKFLRRWYNEPMNEERMLLLDETPDYHTSDLIRKSLNRV